MALCVEISDDEYIGSEEEQNNKNTILITSDEGDGASSDNVTSDDDLPSVNIQEKKTAIITVIFPKTKKSDVRKPVRHKQYSMSKKQRLPASISADMEKSCNQEAKPRQPGVNKMIAGVNVNLPVNPYGSQLALMSTLIRALKNSHNCLLESPTGSGKTLALLCGALGWLTMEKRNTVEKTAQQYILDGKPGDTTPWLFHQPVSPPDVPMEFSPMKTSQESPAHHSSPLKRSLNATDSDMSPIYISPIKSEGMFTKNTFDSPEKGQVHIHKKSKIGTSDSSGGTPKKSNQYNNNSPELPTIYYGARTHKQLEQIIKEFGRTSYCDQFKMTVLSSREHSCIREFDKQLWGTKNEMCRGCLKKVKPKGQIKKDIEMTNCKYYDNRMALHHDRLPSTFDVEDLVKAGHELTACPYFAAREMKTRADIVFCPYNYLIDPMIASSMRMGISDSVVIIDEAHNIEDVCRDAATYAFTREDVGDALKELEIAVGYRYSSNSDALPDIDKLILTLKNWDQWFVNQSQLVADVPLVNNEAVYMWQADHFATTLVNHNIGPSQFFEFQKSVDQLSQLLQNDHETLIGVTQATGTLLESLRIVLGYFFRDECQYMDDYRPALVRTVGDFFQKSTLFKKKEKISLRLICMNPAVVFNNLKDARSIVLASGTLTPLISLESELGTQFPLKISPKHVVSSDRVWIGTLTSHPDGRPLVCKSGDTKLLDTQDAIGKVILWICKVTPNGVLCFVPSYQLMNTLAARWQETGVWNQLIKLKHVFQESKNAKDHNENMEDYYNFVSSEKGAILFAVYRGKVSEGMDFKDHQARAVVTVGVPYPNTYDMAVKAKMQYNDRYCRTRNLLTGQMWLKVQAYRALNQAVGRCVRHIGDWGAVLMIDARFQNSSYTEHLSKWVSNFLQQNHHTFESLTNSPDSLESFMQAMKIKEEDELLGSV